MLRLVIVWFLLPLLVCRKAKRQATQRLASFTAAGPNNMVMVKLGTSSAFRGIGQSFGLQFEIEDWKSY